MFSKHKLDAARIDFHNSFPPTRRSKTCERIDFPSGEYITILHFGWDMNGHDGTNCLALGLIFFFAFFICSRRI